VTYRESAHERGLEAARRRAALAQEKAPRICCDQCDGTGKRKLGFAHAETWDAVRSEWEQTSLINDRLPLVQRTALINRLQELRALGLIENTIDPVNYKRLLWRRTPNA
jgi:hypothetical protein